MAGEAYQVEYNNILKDRATEGIRSFANATKGLTSAADSSINRTFYRTLWN